MRTIFISLIFIFSCCIFNTEAQIGNYMKKKAKQATNRTATKADEEVTDEMNKKIDKEVSKTFDKLFKEKETTKKESDTNDSTKDEKTSTKTSTKTSQSNSNQESETNQDAQAKAMLKAFGINTSAVNVTENYNYSGNILMTIQSWDKNENSEDIVEYKTYMTKDNSGFAMEFKQENKEKSTMIFDYDKKSMIILTDDGKTKSGIVTEYSGMIESIAEAADDYQAEEEDGEIPDYTAYREGLEKTGKTKTIAGYKCEEYFYEDEESTVEMWMTNQLPPELWANMFSSDVISASHMGFYGGFVMEMDEIDKNTKERVYLLVKEVNRNSPSSISTKEYDLMSIGGMPTE